MHVKNEGLRDSFTNPLWNLLAILDSELSKRSLSDQIWNFISKESENIYSIKLNLVYSIMKTIAANRLYLVAWLFCK